MTEKERIEGQSHRKKKRIKDSDAVIHTFTFTDVCFVGILSTQWGSLILNMQGERDCCQCSVLAGIPFQSNMFKLDMDIKVHLHTSVMLNKRVKLVESCLFLDSIHGHLVLKAPVGLNVIKKLLKVIIIKSSFQTMKKKIKQCWLRVEV